AICRRYTRSGTLPGSIGCKKHEILMETPFNERGVTLSRAGLSASGQMIPLRELRTARVIKIERRKPLPIALALLGLAGLAAGIVTGSGAALVLGVMVAVVGYL